METKNQDPLPRSAREDLSVRIGNCKSGEYYLTDVLLINSWFLLFSGEGMG